MLFLDRLWEAIRGGKEEVKEAVANVTENATLPVSLKQKESTMV